MTIENTNPQLFNCYLDLWCKAQRHIQNPVRKPPKVFFKKRCFLEIPQNSQAWPTTLFKKRLWHRSFPVNFTKFLRRLFSQNTSGWLLPVKHPFSLNAPSLIFDRILNTLLKLLLKTIDIHICIFKNTILIQPLLILIKLHIFHSFCICKAFI